MAGNLFLFCLPRLRTGNVLFRQIPTERRKKTWKPGRSRPGACFLHNPGFDFNDEVIPLGAGFLAALVEESLPVQLTARRQG